jgi:asparagine synthase (glutamine-hydrolysing)
MCGISGYYALGGALETDAAIRRMSLAIAHRGPDDEGVTLVNRPAGLFRNLATADTAEGVRDVQPAGERFPHQIAFAHRRYSIIDLSPGGHQPLWSSDREVCVAFNGEIYNYVELRAELEALGHRFRTSSDTEVLAEGYLEWGTDAFARFAGFWAASLYDARTRELLLARDRLGKASLFVGVHDGAFWWSSEIKGLVAGAGAGILRVRERAISDFVIEGRRDVHEHTFYEGIETFPRACWARILPDGSYTPVRYWTIPTRRMTETEITPDEAAAALRERLAEALRVRLRADVPVGFELSGGLDSSTLMAVAATAGHRIRAFTIGFPGSSADEQDFARMVWKRYPDAAELEVVDHETEDFFDVADAAVHLMDEPFHSPNLISIQRIWQQMRRRGMRVTVSGNAGDELFAGYPGVYHSVYLWHLLETGRLRRLDRECVLYSQDPAPRLSLRYAARLRSALAAGLRIHGGSLRQRVAHAVRMRRAERFGLRCSVGPLSPAPARIEQLLVDRVGDWQMNYWLRVANISSMGVPIEIRSPLLDHRVVELAFSLPVGFLIRDGWLKWILRHAMRELLPEEIVWRPRKTGFPFPYQRWLRSSKKRFLESVAGTEIPCVDLRTLEARYDQLVASDPLLLWRFISVSLWYKRCVLGETIRA